MRLDPAKLKSARERLAISQDALARRCELSRKSVQRAEAGLDVSGETAALVAGGLGLGVHELRAIERPEGAPADRLMLRRARSGLRLFETLTRAYVGRITCDVDVSGEIIGPLTRLISVLQGLVSEAWGEPAATPRDLPLLKRLQIVSDLNDDLRALEASGVRCFLGHYYRYVVPGGPAEAVSAAGSALVILARVHLADSLREAMTSPIEAEWMGRGSAATDDPFGAEARFVFLESEPPLTGCAEQAPDEVIDGQFTVLPGRG